MPVEIQEEYKNRVVPALKAAHGYTNINQVPKVDKVVVNTCVNLNQGDAKQALRSLRSKERNFVDLFLPSRRHDTFKSLSGTPPLPR